MLVESGKYVYLLLLLVGISILIVNTVCIYSYQDLLLPYQNTSTNQSVNIHTNHTLWESFNQFLQANPHRFNPEHLYANASRATHRIPNIVHFVFGLAPDFGGKPFNIVHYVSVRSAFQVLKPYKMYFYFSYEPSGFWWELAKPMLTLEQIEPFTHVFGKKVAHVAHKADVIRLQKLVERGGIYHDLDVITLRSYSEDWMHYDFVMAQQGDQARFGLCNAVMMSAPNAWFARNWLREYRNFNARKWDKFSVQIPRDLWMKYPENIHVLSSRRFFWPLFTKPHIDMVYQKDGWDWSQHSEQFAYHAWETVAYGRWMRNLRAEHVWNRTTGFHRILRPFLEEVRDVLEKYGELQS